jgi:hypothetical protein
VDLLGHHPREIVGGEVGLQQLHLAPVHTAVGNRLLLYVVAAALEHRRAVPRLGRLRSVLKGGYLFISCTNIYVDKLFYSLHLSTAFG